MVNEHLSIRLMQKEDIPFGLHLGEMSGWNQVAADWIRIYQYQPDGCFVGEINGEPIGTITTTCYGTELAWIGMMLVHPAHRRQGVATALMNHAMGWLKRKSVQCIKLDATPAGAKVYEQLGFQREWEFHRWMKTGDENLDPTMPDVGEQLFKVSAMDQIAFGVDREDWLKRLAADSKIETDADHFGMLRTGRLADYLGPVIASNENASRSIIESLLSSSKRTIFWDVPGPNAAAMKLAEEFGFTRVRPLLRMWYGERLISGSPNFQFALASPATG